MKRAWLISTIVAMTSVVLAACGGTSKTSTSTGSPTPASATTSRGGAGGYGGGAYGSGASASSGTASSASSSSSSSSATQVSAKHNKKLGMILAAGSKQLTVYLFEGDKGMTSSCTGACASAWPPVTTSGNATATGQAMSADLGTITRSDGTKQVTYKGHPLYYFASDKDSGDAYGEGVKAFGASWYVLAPSGRKIDNS